MSATCYGYVSSEDAQAAQFVVDRSIFIRDLASVEFVLIPQESENDASIAIAGWDETLKIDRASARKLIEALTKS